MLGAIVPQGLFLWCLFSYETALSQKTTDPAFFWPNFPQGAGCQGTVWEQQHPPRGMLRVRGGCRDLAVTPNAPTPARVWDAAGGLKPNLRAQNFPKSPAPHFSFSLKTPSAHKIHTNVIQLSDSGHCIVHPWAPFQFFLFQAYWLQIAGVWSAA